MLKPWYCASLLAFEAHDVMRLRTMKIAGGGTDALLEVHLMITEKIGATVEALSSIMFGGTPMSVIERYREHVAVNAYRLAGDLNGPISCQSVRHRGGLRVAHTVSTARQARCWSVDAATLPDGEEAILVITER